jgi:hypothetical protein
MPSRRRRNTLLTAGTLGGIAAVITAVATLIAVFYDPQPNPPVPSPEPPTTPTSDDAGPGVTEISPTDDATETTSKPNITVGTDKESYTNGEVITISGNVGKPESGKALRIDVYNPTGDVIFFANGIKVYPNERGFYTYDVNTEIATIRDMTPDGELVPGKYEVLVSYLNQSAEDTFDIE